MGATRMLETAPARAGEELMKSIPWSLLPTLLVAVVSASSSMAASAQTMMSASYKIEWDVVDSGGGTMSSDNYTLQGSIGQVAAGGVSTSTSYALVSGFHAPPDSDSDGFRDFIDNCSIDFNPDQFDSNGDGYGNLCDADLNNDEVGTNLFDLQLLISAFRSTPADADWNPDADLTGPAGVADNEINLFDLNRMIQLFREIPGPSGLAPR